jgi:hypothetical protein
MNHKQLISGDFAIAIQQFRVGSAQAGAIRWGAEAGAGTTATKLHHLKSQNQQNQEGQQVEQGEKDGDHYLFLLFEKGQIGGLDEQKHHRCGDQCAENQHSDGGGGVISHGTGQTYIQS